MSAILANYFDEFEPTNVKPPSRPKNNISRKKTRSPKTDLHLWLSNNAPRDVEELNAVRYTLYHRCSRADFKVSKKQDDDDFMLSGRQTSVHVISNKARRYLLWKLRILAREQGWVRRKHIQLVVSS
jgi:hypothetical protein